MLRSLLVLISVFCFSVLAQDLPDLLKRHYLSKFEQSNQNAKSSRLVDLNVNRISFVMEALTEDELHKPSKISAKQLREYWIDTWADKFTQSSVMHNSDLAEQLQLFSRPIFEPETVWGEVYGAYLLLSGATTNLELLRERQAFIRSLVEQDDYRLSLTDKLISLKQSQATLVDLFHPQGELAQYIEAHYVFPNDHDLQSDWLLLKNPLRLPSLIVSKYSSILAMPAETIGLMAVFNGFLTVRSWRFRSFINGAIWRSASLGLGAVSATALSWTAYEQYKTHDRLSELEEFLTSRLKNLELFLDGISNMSSLELTEKDRQYFNNVLGAIRSIQPSDVISLYPNLVRASIIAENMVANKVRWDRLLLEIGRLDFYVAVANTKPGDVDFISSRNSRIIAKKLRHPQLDKTSSVANDIDLTQMLLTGSNASGKSTLMRAVGINTFYLAQTLGVAMAESFALTPFHSFFAFMETQDKTGESSSYQTELNRIIVALKTSQELNAQSKPSFYMADELFSSTNAVDALIGSQEVLDRWNALEHSVGIVSSHLDGLRSSHQKYHMKAYQLVEGPNTEKSGLQILYQELEKNQTPNYLQNLASLQPRTKQEIIFELFQEEFSDRKSVKINSNIWADLELSNAFEQFFPTQTVLGSVYRDLFLFSQVTSDAELLKRRQDKIRELVDDPKKFETIQSQLKTISQFETTLVNLYDGLNWLNSRQVRELYPQDEAASEKIVLGMFPLSMNLEVKHTVLEQNRAKTRLDNTNFASLLLTHIMHAYLSLPLSLLYDYKLVTWVLRGKSGWPTKSFFVAWNALGLQGLFQGPYYQHKRLADLAPKLSREMSALVKILDSVLELEEFGLQIPSQDRKLIQELLAKSRILGLGDDWQFLFDLVQSQILYRLFLDLRKPLAKIFFQVGELDFHASVAKKMIENPERVSFAQYSEGPSHIEANQIWNPLLPIDKAVSNNMVMGSPKLLLVTGPNASGKSTWMRSVAINIYLAQTIGVVAASSMQLTAFTHFNSFMKHEDKIGTESSYQSEVRKMREILQIYETLAPDDRAFMILDELFRSTNPQEAEQASRLVIERFVQHPQLLMMVATHLRGLSDLGVNQHLENYQVQLGVGTESSALSLLRERLGDNN